MKLKMIVAASMFTLLSLLSVSLTPALAAHAASTVTSEVCTGIQSTQATGDNKCSDTKNTGVNSVVKSAINILSFIIGAVSVVMIIIGGFRYIVSGGDSGQIGSAKNTIIYAVVGLIIVIFAQIIVHFVIGNVSAAANANS